MTDPVRAGAAGRCPRCGKGKLYRGVLKLADRCANCGLDLQTFNVGDGAAAFLILILGTIIVGLALWVELAYAPPLWVHVLLWTPLIAASSVASIRVSKGIMLALEYRNQAAEGRLDDRA